MYNAARGTKPLNCYKCSASDEKRSLTKCPICHKMYCDDCRFNISGRYFCSSQCAQFFFHDDEGEEGEE